jgi:endonuclease III
MKKSAEYIYEPSVKNIDRILVILAEDYPASTHTSLGFKNAFQLLVATILSAQSTDKLVNRITPALFKKYKTPQDFVHAGIEELENDIRSTGFFHNKAKNIKGCAEKLIKDFNSIVPDNIKDLTSLPGVGRKTANVVLSNIYGAQAIIVDTHVQRISQRLGLTINSDPDKIESDLMKIIPEDEWTLFSNQIIAHGRTICDAKKPKCPVCRILPYCRFGQETV